MISTVRINTYLGMCGVGTNKIGSFKRFLVFFGGGFQIFARQLWPLALTNIGVHCTYPIHRVASYWKPV